MGHLAKNCFLGTNHSQLVTHGTMYGCRWMEVILVCELDVDSSENLHV